MKRPVPKSVKKRLAELYGRNPFGQPLYRVIWGEDRLTLMIGTKDSPWVDSDAEGNFIREATGPRWVPKYALQGVERWYIERWLSAEEYAGSKENWDKFCAAEMGPYPAEGEYEHCFTLPRAMGSDLTASVVDFIIQTIERSREMVRADKAKAKQALEDAQKQKLANWERDAEAQLADSMSAFNGPAVTVPQGFEQDKKSGLYLPN